MQNQTSQQKISKSPLRQNSTKFMRILRIALHPQINSQNKAANTRDEPGQERVEREGSYQTAI